MDLVESVVIRVDLGRDVETGVASFRPTSFGRRNPADWRGSCRFQVSSLGTKILRRFTTTEKSIQALELFLDLFFETRRPWAIQVQALPRFKNSPRRCRSRPARNCYSTSSFPEVATIHAGLVSLNYVAGGIVRDA